MGLDMYLRKKTYVGNQYKNENEKVKIVDPKNRINQDKVSYIIEEIGYWRKANAIHNWFVHNVQGGVDECEEYHVPELSLRQLLDTVNKVIDSKDAKELLPTPGFFFGSTAIDDIYWEDMMLTQKIISEAIENCKIGTVYYQSSW